MEKKIFILLFHKHDWVNSLSKWCCVRVNPLWNIHCIDDSNLQKYISLSFLTKLNSYDFNTRMLLYMLFLASHYGGICILSNVLCLSSFDNFLKEATLNADNYYYNRSIIISKDVNPFLKQYLQSFLQNSSLPSLSLNKSSFKKKYFELIPNESITLEDSKITNTCKFHQFQFSHAKLYTFNSHVLNIFPSLHFIHVGKCGGTAIMYNFMKNGIHLEQYHLNRPNNETIKQKYFLLWIRNPLSRFVSAFYHAKNTLQGDESLIPYRKDKKSFVFSETYDNLISRFETANDLALNLSRGHLHNRKNAMDCVFSGEEHILKGLGYYTYNGDFIHKNKNRIFVGRLEHFEQDLKYFVESKLKVPFTLHMDNKIRENKNNNDKSLSQEAIDNLIAFYQDSDYKALKTLLEYDLISNETFYSYFRY